MWCDCVTEENERVQISIGVVSADEFDSALVQLRNCWMEENEKIAGAWYFACCLELCFYAG